MLKRAQRNHLLELGPIFPFLKYQTIEYVVETYDKYVVNPEGQNYDSAFTVRTLNCSYYDSDTDFIREDRPNTVIEDGILYAFKRTGFRTAGNRKVGKICIRAAAARSRTWRSISRKITG